MSRFGKLPVTIPEGVQLTFEKRILKAVGPKGELNVTVPREVEIKIEDGAANVATTNQSRLARALQGTFRSHTANMIKGVTELWSKSLDISGPGYKAELQGTDLVLTVGYSHPVKFKAEEGVTFKVEKSTITVEGGDKQKVGQISSLIRGARPVNPYTGSGIKYSDEIVKRKAGKQTAKAGA
jgi:large subunit ribosomal protein L6